MNLQEIKSAILGLDQDQLLNLNNYVCDRSKQLGREKRFEFRVGQKIQCDGQTFIISKLNRTKAKCVKEGTTQMWNIPFSRMTA